MNINPDNNAEFREFKRKNSNNYRQRLCRHLKKRATIDRDLEIKPTRKQLNERRRRCKAEFDRQRRLEEERFIREFVFFRPDPPAAASSVSDEGEDASHPMSSLL